MKPLFFVRAGLFSCCVFLLTLPAQAAGLQRLEQNASGLGVAYAGSGASAENASVLFANPAAMDVLPGIQLSFGAVAVDKTIRFSNDASTGSLGIGNGGEAGLRQTLPNFFATWKMTPRFHAGIGVSSSVASAVSYDEGWLGQGLTQKAEMTSRHINPALSFQVNEKVALGLGLDYQKIDGEWDSLGINREADDAAWGWNAGVLLTPSPRMRVGIAFRSAIKQTLTGHSESAGQRTVAHYDFRTPDTLTFSVWQQISPQWEAMGDLSYSRWSALSNLTGEESGAGIRIPLNYKNSWRVAWGAAYLATENLKIKFGLSYEKTPINRNFISSRLPETNRYTLAVGGQWKAAYGAFDVGYSYVYMRPRNIHEADLRLPVVLDGRYRLGEHRLGLQYSVGF